MKRLSKISIIFIVIVITMLSGCGKTEKAGNGQAAHNYEGNKLYIDFKEKFPNREAIICEHADVTNDGLEDLIIIYKEDKNTRLIVATDSSEGVKYTNEVPAPIENQSIKLKNIDDEKEMEFIVSGSKMGNLGYAIFRVENMVLTDLFGDGMEDCC